MGLSPTQAKMQLLNAANGVNLAHTLLKPGASETEKAKIKQMAQDHITQGDRAVESLKSSHEVAENWEKFKTAAHAFFSSTQPNESIEQTFTETLRAVKKTPPPTRTNTPEN